MFTSAYVFVTNRCNLACTYCYESNRVGDMPTEMMSKTIDWLWSQRDKQEKARPDQEICLTFFGGEPLLNFPVVKHGIEYCKGICDTTGSRIGLYILTNGTVLTDEMVQYFKIVKSYQNISFHLQVSIDGCKESHDKNRVFRGGEGSFDKIAANILRLREIFPDLIVRQTVTPENIDNLSKDFSTLLNSGGVITNLTPIVEGDWSEKNSDTYVSELCNCLDMFSNHPGSKDMAFNMIHSKLLRIGDPTFNSYRGCRAGVKLVGITVDGDIYPCHRFVAYKNEFDFNLGNVSTGIDYSGENWAKLEKMHSDATNECGGCNVITCNRCYATNLHMSKVPSARPTNGYCEMNSKLSVSLKAKLLDMLSKRQIGLRWGEMIKEDNGGIIANVDGVETESFENPLDLMARCMVSMTKELAMIKSKINNIEKSIGVSGCGCSDKNNIKS